MDIIIADDSSPRTRVRKHQFYTFDQVDEATSSIYFTILEQDLPRLHTSLGLVVVVVVVAVVVVVVSSSSSSSRSSSTILS